MKAFKGIYGFERDIGAELARDKYCYLGGGGNSGEQTSTSYQTNLPEYAQPYYEEMMDRTQKESLRANTPYTGDRTAAPSSLQTGMRGEVANMVNPMTLGMAEKALTGLQTAPAAQYTASQFDAAAAKQYMDPYMQSVVDQQKAELQKDYARQANVNAAQAVKAGAFGGGREGAERAVAQDEMLDRMAQAQATGLQQAFGQAREEFGAAETRKQAEAQSGQQAEQMKLNVAKAQEQLATTQQGLQEARLKLQGAVGAEEKAEAQRELDLKYEEFINARDNERQNLAFYNALLRGIPVPTQSQVIQYQPTSGAAQLAGLGLAGLGAYKQFG
jgi:hypothetical protein